MPADGLLLSFEGIDGCGKTTQLRLLAKRLREQGRTVRETAEPGGTAVGDQIRRILLDPAHQELSPHAEVLLYFAARAQNVDEVIRPTLAQGEIVLTDRFTDSTLAYQGHARGLGSDLVLTLDRIACRGLVPALTLWLDIDLEISLQRTAARRRAQGRGDRMEEQSACFRQVVRDAYQQLAAAEPERVRVVDGRGTVGEVAQRVWDAVLPLLPANHP